MTLRTVVAFALALAACTPAGRALDRSASGTTTLTSVTTLDEAEVAAVLRAEMEGEIARARLAESRATDADVRDLARRVRAEEAAALASFDDALRAASLAPREGGESRRVRSDDAVVARGLAASHAFDRDYARAVANDARRALREIDDVLVPNARTQAVRDAIAAMRARDERDARDAQAILRALR